MMTCKIIKETVEQVSNIKDISTRRKYQYLADCRVVYSALCNHYIKELGRPSLNYIGNHINRNHATILHHKKVFNACYGTDGFKANDIYTECLDRINLLIDNPTPEMIEMMSIDAVKKYYRIKFMTHQEKTRSIINSLYHKLSMYRKNDFVKKCVTLSDKDIAELEFKFDAFFKVKQKLKNSKQVN